ncbi:MAG: hypothetical protein E6165_07055, partial [Varibaculum cambriense]|nr:hypothetical protein [Varibaculum cambriense]
LSRGVLYVAFSFCGVSSTGEDAVSTIRPQQSWGLSTGKNALSKTYAHGKDFPMDRYRFGF